MRRAKVIGTVLIAVTCVALSAAGTATAVVARTVAPRPGLFFGAHLPLADGWSIYLRGSGPHRVELDISNPERAASYTTMNYSTGGRVGRDGIEADLGRFGHVDLHFSGAPEKYVERFQNCGGNYRQIVHTGTLTGNLEFAALAGPPPVDLESVEGEIRGPTKGVCKPRRVIIGPETPRPTARAAAGFESPSEELRARRRSKVRTIEVDATRVTGEIVLMAASSTRGFGNVLVATSVRPPFQGGPGEAGRLTTTGKADLPTGATMRVAAPFSGVGRYRRSPGRPPTWLGSLMAVIPGEGKLHLAGPGFRAIVCGYENARHQRACERKVAPPLTA
jgi:hypothetical protein